MRDQRDFETLLAYLRRMPAISGAIGSGEFENLHWWVKFTIDIAHPLAWHVVQELGCVLNALSIHERLPTVFMPVSPAPYMNGGPEESLSWIIESTDPSFEPGTAAQWLEARLPNPVDDLVQWSDQSGG